MGTPWPSRLPLLRLDLTAHGLRSHVLLDLMQFAMGGRPDPGMVGHGLHHFDQPGQLVLRQQVDLQVRIGPLVGRRGHTVLADQDESGQEDRLYEASIARTTKAGSQIEGLRSNEPTSGCKKARQSGLINSEALASNATTGHTNKKIGDCPLDQRGSHA